MYIKCNIWRVVVRQSYIKDARFLKVKKELKLFLLLQSFYSVEEFVFS